MYIREKGVISVDSENIPSTQSSYMTVQDMENYVPIEIFNMALDRLTILEQAVDALPDYTASPTVSRVTTLSENMGGNFTLRWSASDPTDRELEFYLKLGVGEFKRVFPLSSGGYHVYTGIGAPDGYNPSYLKVTNGDKEVISDVFSVNIPADPSIVAPHIEKIDNVVATVGEPIKLIYIAYDEKTDIIKHEFSDDGKTYDITNKVQKAGDKYIYTLRYDEFTTINKAYITVYNRNGLRKKSDDFSIVVSEPVTPPALLSFEIVPHEYKSTSDTITIKYKTEVPLENVKISFNNTDYVSASKFNNEEATFSIKGKANGNYTVRLRGYYKEDARNVKNN